MHMAAQKPCAIGGDVRAICEGLYFHPLPNFLPTPLKSKDFCQLQLTSVLMPKAAQNTRENGGAITAPLPCRQAGKSALLRGNAKDFSEREANELCGRPATTKGEQGENVRNELCGRHARTGGTRAMQNTQANKNNIMENRCKYLFGA